MRTTAALVTGLLLLVACSGSGDDDSGGAATPESTTGDSQQTTTGGATQTDEAGNSITLHGWSPWPDQMALLDPYDAGPREESLYGNVANAGDIGAGLWAIDVEVCPIQDDPAGFWEFVSAAGETSIANVDPQLLSPVFRWPAAGECARGWQGLEAPGGATPQAVRFVAGVGDTLEWILDAPVVATPASEAYVVDTGETVVLGGDFEGWTVKVEGWTEVADTATAATPSGAGFAQPVEGTYLAAVLLEWCYEIESDGVRPTPTFGIQVDGWNLMRQFEPGAPWGAGFDQLQVPEPQSCTEGWAAFEVPLGAQPGGLFVSDNNNTDDVWQEWPFGPADLLEQPTGDGLPAPEEVGAALAACGVAEPLEVTFAGQDRSGQIVSAAAIPTGAGRLDVYLSGDQLLPTDIPQPADPSQALVAVALEQTDGTPMAPGTFTGSVSSSQYGTVSLVPGGEGSGITIFVGATVDVTEITESHICGRVAASAGADGVNGPFAAPIWQPES